MLVFYIERLTRMRYLLGYKRWMASCFIFELEEISINFLGDVLNSGNCPLDSRK